MNAATTGLQRFSPKAAGSAGGYDIAVIGAGSAGFSAAITAAEQGARVAFVGHGTVGGTCVNVGCVPSKRLIRAAEALHHARSASRFAGLTGTAEVADWPALVAEKDALVGELRQAKYLDVLRGYPNVSYVEGAARLVEGGVQVGDRLIRADKVVIATGARPAVPAIPGLEEVHWLTSTAALELAAVPATLLVIGGGVIGCELGQMFARFGAKVTICCRSRLLPEMEPEISTALKQYLEAEGIIVCEGIGYQEIERTAKCVALTCEDKGGTRVIAAEQVLVATGRRPNSEHLGLEAMGVQCARNGGIVVDDHLETHAPGIYAAGDVTGRDQFVYMAAYGAKLAAWNALNGNTCRYDNSTMPAVVFTDPQVASVGLTEAAARAAGHAVRTSTIGLEHVPRALAAKDTRGLVKLVADAGSGRLLGAHILAPEGCDSIQTAALAIRHRMTARDLGETIFPYLTTVEGLKLAAQTFDKDVARLSCCAG